MGRGPEELETIASPKWCTETLYCKSSCGLNRVNITSFVWPSNHPPLFIFLINNCALARFSPFQSHRLPYVFVVQLALSREACPVSRVRTPENVLRAQLCNRSCSNKTHTPVFILVSFIVTLWNLYLRLFIEVVHGATIIHSGQISVRTDFFLNVIYTTKRL
jgi:hypothetical protein